MATPVLFFIETVHGGEGKVASQRCGQGMPHVERITLGDRVW